MPRGEFWGKIGSQAPSRSQATPSSYVNPENRKSRINGLARELRKVAKAGLDEPDRLLKLDKLLRLSVVKKEAEPGADSLALARTLTTVLRGVLNDLLAEASPERTELITCLFKLDSRWKDLLIGARREHLAGGEDTSTFRRRTEWPLYEQIATLLIERSTPQGDLPKVSPHESEIGEARQKLLGCVGRYEHALAAYLYPVEEDSSEYMHPVAHTPPAILSLRFHGAAFEAWQDARGVISPGGENGFLDELTVALIVVTPFDEFDRSLLAHTLRTTEHQIAPFQIFLEDTERGNALLAKWEEWLKSCLCINHTDPPKPGRCSVHTHLHFCNNFMQVEPAASRPDDWKVAHRRFVREQKS